MSLKNGERQRFFAPSITTQFDVCPVPFKVDSYNGCSFGCRACFARYFVEYSRRNNPDENLRKFSHLEMNDPVKFKAWLDRAVSTKEINYNHGAIVAIQERIPLKFGAIADPFPPIEIKYRITYDMLQALHEHDYPVQILTKNPAMLCRYAPDFKNPNWAVSVSIISIDEKFIRTAEPGAPPPMVRLKAVEKLAAMGLPVMCKVQPAIYPRILKDLPDLVKAFKDHGAWAMNCEGLKNRVSMKPSEQAIFEQIGKYSGDDEFMGLGIRKYYRLRGTIVGPDYEITKNRKMEYINLAVELADRYGIKMFVADNHMGRIGSGCECCGTEKLRNYKIWGECHRVKSFGKFKHESQHMKKVIYNSFSYSGNPNRYRTLGDIMNDELNKKGQIF